MKPATTVVAARDKLLFTPGPITTSLSVKQAMLHDAGSWHFEFNALVASVRSRLLHVAGLASRCLLSYIPTQPLRVRRMQVTVQRIHF